MTGLVYSAYNAAPPGLADDPRVEDDWYAALRTETRISGLELPYAGGGLHPRGLARLASLLNPGWTNTISPMPLTLVTSSKDPDYGLASADSEARNRALLDIAAARTETVRLQDELGASAVRAFALHSAPRADRANADAFADSLRRIASWEWGDIELLVEHSDALIAGQKPEKGYLSLAEEMDAVHSASEAEGRRIRLLLNWGRSAIEGRDAGTPQKHVEQVNGSLGAFTFSGASPSATQRSAEWEDAHLGLSSDEPASLLDAAVVAKLTGCLPDDLNYIGIKTGAPAGSRGLDRLRLGLNLLRAVDGHLSTNSSSTDRRLRSA